MTWFAPHARGIASTLLIAVTLVSCSNPEADRLREENAQLKSQLETVSQERDALKTQVESVRAALGQGSGAMTSSGTGSGDTTSSATVSPAVLAYAQEVLKVATTYGAETGTPPRDCATGYETGSNKLALGEGIALKSCAVEMVNDQLRVNLETADSAKLSVPSNGP